MTCVLWTLQNKKYHDTSTILRTLHFFHYTEVSAVKKCLLRKVSLYITIYLLVESPLLYADSFCSVDNDTHVTMRVVYHIARSKMNQYYYTPCAGEKHTIMHDTVGLQDTVNLILIFR